MTTWPAPPSLTDELRVHLRAPKAPAAQLIVGRGAEAGIEVADPRVSRRHLAVRQGRVTEVCDLGSRNGSAICRDDVRSPLEAGRWTTLRPGDRVVTADGVELWRCDP